MRHVLVHDYANVVSATLYDTAVNDIPLLRRQVEKYLTNTDWVAWESENDSSEGAAENSAHAYSVKVAMKMKLKGYSAKEIADITGLNIGEIESL